MSVGLELNSDAGDFAGVGGDEDGITTSSLSHESGIQDGTQDLFPEVPGPAPPSVTYRPLRAAANALYRLRGHLMGQGFVSACTRVAILAFILQNFALVSGQDENTTTPTRIDEQESVSRGRFQFPIIPRFIDEWVALIPLVVYLSSPRSAHDLAGEVALRGRLSASAFPKLWALGGIAKMLQQAEVFFDTAGAAGDPLKVYDVQWGSVFPCYNNAAALAVEENAFAGTKTDRPDISREHLNTWVLRDNREQFLPWFEACGDAGVVSEVHCGRSIDDLVNRKAHFGRRQLLKVLVVRKSEMKNNRRKKLRDITRTTYWKTSELVVSLAIATVLLKYWLFGSGLLLAIGAFSRALLHTVEFKRSDLYLLNRETHDGCMLTSLHDNATAWTLYLGHRGMIDSLLNKPMVEPGRAHPIVRWYFEFAELPQVLAMTYVAAQKGWDGVAFVVLMGLMWVSTSLSGNNKHAARWLEEEGFVLDSFTCEFPGRSELLGAVQLLSTEKKTYWMNGILAPVPRREVWLRRIGALESNTGGDDPDWDSLSSHDKEWVNSTGMQTMAGYNLMKQKLSGMAATPESEPTAGDKV